MLKSNYEFEVIINGSSAKEYYHEGHYYIEGKKGSKFSLRMCNNSSERALFVPTVDGLSIMSGKEASFRSQGYIVNSHDSITIRGWRTSDDNVAKFFFAAPNKSYATKKGKGGNLGIIGCAVFKEKDTVNEMLKIIIEKERFTPYVPFPIQPWHPTQPHWYSTTTAHTGNCTLDCSGSVETSAASVNAFSAHTTSAGLGTGFGEDTHSPVVSVSFDQEERPTTVFSLRYNTEKNLVDLGVEFKKPVYIAPSAFPNEEGYCERP